ncbi:MAG: O-antigen ligase family protein [Thermoleophilia bacterium]
MSVVTAAGPTPSVQGPAGSTRRSPVPASSREWLIAALMLLLPIERVFVLQVGTITVRPVFAVMALIVGRELAVRDWPWAVSRGGQRLTRGVLLGVFAIVASLVAGVWPFPNLGYALWLIFSAVFLAALVRTITVRADLDRWAHWAVTAATFWSSVTLLQWVLAISVLPQWAYSFMGPLPRVHALTYEPSFLALYLLPHIFLAHQTGRRRALGTITLALVLSTSRLGLIGLVAGLMATVFLNRRRRRKTLQLTAALAVGIAMLTALLFAAGAGGTYTRMVGEAFNSTEASSSAPRLESWDQARRLASENMPFGVGPGGYGEAVHERGEALATPTDELKTTNLWLETLAEIGVLGVVALLAWSVVPLVRLRSRTGSGVEAGLFLGGCATLATFPLFQTWERPQLWVWWGLVWAAAVMPLHGQPAMRRLGRATSRRRATAQRRVRASRPSRVLQGQMPRAVAVLRQGGHVRRVGMALSGRVAATLASIALNIVTARALGPTDRGVLVLAILAGWLASIPVRSVTSAIAYELGLVQRGVGGNRGGLISDSWRAAGIALVPSAIGLAAVVLATGWGPEVALVGAATLVSALIVGTPYGVALADGRMGRLGWLTAAPPVGAMAGAFVALALGGADLLHVVIGWSTGIVLGTVLSVDSASVRALREKHRERSVQRQFWFSLKSAGTSFVTTTANRVDVLLLGLLATTTSVGLYSVAIGASELVWFIGEALAITAYGRIGASAHADAVRATWRLCGVTMAIAAVQAVVLAVIAHDAMQFVFGEPFRVSGDYLQILVIGTVLGAPVFPVSSFLTNQLGRPMMAFALAVATLGASALACLVAIPQWGATGAAIGSTVGYGVGAVIALVMLVVTGRPRPAEEAVPPSPTEGHVPIEDGL